MKLKEMTKVDSKGRITIPLVIREALDVREGMNVVIIADVEKKEIVLTPLPKESKLLEVTFEIVDRPGSLAEVTSELAKTGVDLVLTKCTTIKRGEVAECSIVIDVSKSIIVNTKELEELLAKIEVVKLVKIREVMRK
ncbi:MAG: AbrB family transcriptional regulator [Desulfurococcaceae archaeon]